MGGMDEQRYCRLRVIGDNLDLAGPAAALRALAKHLRDAPATTEVTIRNGAVRQERTAGPLHIELTGSPTLGLAGADDDLRAVWDALETVAAESETGAGSGTAPHRHVARLVITADWPAAPDGL